MKKKFRASFRDNTAILFRMLAGFPGDVNRMHPASIEPSLIDASAPPTLYGQPVLMDATTQGARPFAAGDQSNTVVATPYGFTVRPYPLQQTSGNLSASIGNATPPISGIIDLLRFGYIMAQLNIGVTAPVKGGAVYVWCAATSGNHIQGGLETAYSAGNTVLLDARCTYNGGPDANGVCEIAFLG